MKKTRFHLTINLLLSLIFISLPATVFGANVFDTLSSIILPQGIPCVSVFSEDLQLHSESLAVLELQKILNISPETRVSTDGPGSPENETAYFGPLTYKAVIKFQNKYFSDILAPLALPTGTGFVGVSTRAKIGEICLALSSGMNSGDLISAALNGFRRTFYSNLGSFKLRSNSSPKTESSPVLSNISSSVNISTTPVSTSVSTTNTTPKPKPASTPPLPATIPTPTTPPVTSSGYPLHKGITATVFWVGEPKGGGSSEDNALSAWDDDWEAHYGGYDDYQNRVGFLPVGFTPKENPFYLDFPYNDFTDSGNRKSNAYQVVPWANEKTWGKNESMMKNRWVKLIRGSNTCYGQIEDAGPYEYDDHAYVFGPGDAKPKTTLANNAGLDVSPALRDCLKFTGLNDASNKIDWQFVNFSDVPPGPWKEIITTSQINW